MKAPEEMWPEFRPRTVSELCAEVGVTRQAVWQLIDKGSIPAPLRISARTRVYPPEVFAAIVSQLKSGMQDRETQKIMRAILRARERLAKLRAKEAKLEAREAALVEDLRKLQPEGAI